MSRPPAALPPVCWQPLALQGAPLCSGWPCCWLCRGMSSQLSLCVCSDFGKAAHIEAFSGARCALRRSDGAEVAANVSPHPLMLHQLVAASKWSQATRLCRFVKVCPADVVPAGDSAVSHWVLHEALAQQLLLSALMYA